MDEMMGLEEEEEDEQMLELPGFRFHPTDEELVGFYLSKKILLKKPNKIDEIIRGIDIYKFDPWDLPRSRNTEKENYFFCKRGRKYKNSVRPNRVTSSGFWKATGIDKPVYSEYSNNNNKAVIGLKKTLVYYLGSAGKGNKTDWMMHEFRLPTPNDTIPGSNIHPNPNPTSSSLLDAEVWTLCRIFKRNVSSRKYTPEWREVATGNKGAKQQQQKSNYQEAYISFCDNESCSSTNNNIINVREDKGSYERSNTFLQLHNQTSHHDQHQLPIFMDTTTTTTTQVGSMPVMPQFSNDNISHETYENWDELRSVVEFAFPPSSLS